MKRRDDSSDGGHSLPLFALTEIGVGISLRLRGRLSRHFQSCRSCADLYYALFYCGIIRQL
jgi:hypothetical protein